MVGTPGARDPLCSTPQPRAAWSSNSKFKDLWGVGVGGWGGRGSESIWDGWVGGAHVCRS